MNYKTLASRAASARKFSHSPYSNFRVGAALLTKSGKVYTGCNIEISTFALTICGERTALFKAVSEGENRFTAIAIATDEPDFTSPCGACRQVLFDLAGNIDVILRNNSGDLRVMKVTDFFPHPFGAGNLHVSPKNRRRTRKK